MAEYYSIVHIYHNFFIHSTVDRHLGGFRVLDRHLGGFRVLDRHLGGFRVLAIVNSAAMNTGVCVSFSIMVSSGYMPNIGIVELYGSFIPSGNAN